MNYYKKHFFFCCNQREGGKQCCNDQDACSMRLYAKDQIKALGLNGKGGVRVNLSGCLGRCKEGPTTVIYPEGVWYTYHSKEDINEIIEKHIIGGEVVSRLLMTND